MSSSWQDLEATRRGLLREVNDRIAEVGAGFERAELPFVCECGSQDCIRAIDLSLREYESVRLHARRFAIVPDHENPTVEIVVQETGRFAVVETFVGEASRIPEETDPRKQVSRELHEVGQLGALSAGLDKAELPRAPASLTAQRPAESRISPVSTRI
jgi:hypothetical protein